MKTKPIILIIVLVLIIAGGSYAYAHYSQVVETVTSPSSTAKVRQGDLQINVSGSGDIVVEEIPLSFLVPGEVKEVNVSMGEMVQPGQVLARLDSREAELDLAGAQLDLDALSGPQAIVEAEQRLLEVQQELEDAQEALQYLLDGPPVWYYEMLLSQAEAEYEAIFQDYRQVFKLSLLDPKTYQPSLTRLARQKNRAGQALETAETNLEWAQNYQPDPQALDNAQAQVALASTRLTAQESLLNVLNGDRVPNDESILDSNDQLRAIERAYLALDKASWALSQVDLVSPSAGIVTQISVAPGERVNGNPVITISMQEPLLVRFYVEETDLSQIDAGDPIEIRLAAYPDEVFEGKVLSIDPALMVQDGSTVAQVWGEFTTQPDVSLIPGMSLEVDVIAAQASDTLIIPLQALRENADGTFYVEIPQADGSLLAVPVTIGLSDLANVQIIAGLQVGDQVSIAAP